MSEIERLEYENKLIKINRDWFVVTILSIIVTTIVSVWYGSTLVP